MSKSEHDMEILFPDQTVTIGSETVTVREFRYREGIEATVLARGFLAGLRALLTTTGDEIAAEDLDTLIAEHREAWFKLIAMSCGREVEWLAGLPDREAMKLQMAFWGVNSNFFTRRLLWGAAFAAAVKVRRSPSPMSSPSSSPPASDETTTTLPDNSPGGKSSDISA
ncbi:MAG: hypothetical protein Q7J84_13855 [Sulfuricaulis sp.]|nr:hypothetical protein [Sulfuricaulis sp.]